MGSETAEQHYMAAVEAMRISDHRAAQKTLEALIDRINQDDPAISEALAAHVFCTYATSLSESGADDDAMFWHQQCAARYSHAQTAEARSAAAQSDLSRAMMLREKGDAVEAHALLNQLTLRTMMESHPDIRAIFYRGSETMKALASAHGISDDNGLRGDAPQTSAQNASAPITYEKVKSLFEKTPRIWRVEEKQLIVSQHGSETVVPFADIKQITLRYVPGRYARNRFTITLDRKSGKPLETDNMSFVGVGQFEDRSRAYRTMIETLAQRIAAQGFNPSVNTGGGMFGMIGRIALLGFMAMIIFFISLLAGPLGALAYLALLAFYAKTLWRWVKRNAPGDASITALPVRCLPE